MENLVDFNVLVMFLPIFSFCGLTCGVTRHYSVMRLYISEKCSSTSAITVCIVIIRPIEANVDAVLKPEGLN